MALRAAARGRIVRAASVRGPRGSRDYGGRLDCPRPVSIAARPARIGSGAHLRGSPRRARGCP
jgi:hypothetical protein